MDLDGIIDFIILADCRSFSKAAESRRVTQSAFSRRIQSLEANLGVALVDRDVTPIALTKAGERFLVHARLLSETLDQAVDEAQSQISALEDPVFVATPHALSYSFFPQWYRNLQRKIPNLRITLSPQRGSKCVGALRNGLADLALIMVADEVSTCFDLKGIETKLIGEEKLVAIKAKHLKDDVPDFLSYEKGSYMAAMAQHLLQTIGKADLVKTVFESASSELLRSMALAGFGTAILPESLVSDDLAQGFLVPAFAKNPALSCRILLLKAQKVNEDKTTAIWNSVA